MELSRRKFLGGSAVLAATVVLPFPMMASAKDYIDPEWRKLVPMQPGNPDGTTQMLHYLDNVYEPYIYDPLALKEDFIFRRGPQRMNLELLQLEVGDDQFIYSEDEIALAVKETVRSLPEREIIHVFDCRGQCNSIALQTRRGAANTHMYGTWYYRGATNMVDGPFFVMHKEFRGKTRYAIIKHPKFDKYGFHMTKPVPDKVGYGYGDPKDDQRLYVYEVDRYEKDGMIFHEPLPKTLRKIKA